MNERINVLNAESSKHLGSRPNQDLQLNASTWKTWLNSIEDREDVAIFAEAFIQLKRSQKKTEKAILLDWNDVRDRW